MNGGTHWDKCNDLVQYRIVRRRRARAIYGPALHEPLQTFRKPAFRKTRLTDFSEGSAALLIEHQNWLIEAAHAIPDNRDFHIYIFGYASKLGFRGQDQIHSDASNVALSYERGSRVAKFLEQQNVRVRTHIDTFLARGNCDYSAGPMDNSGLWRAVEVFIFLDEPPPPPPHAEPPPPALAASGFGSGPLRHREALHSVLRPERPSPAGPIRARFAEDQKTRADHHREPELFRDVVDQLKG